VGYPKERIFMNTEYFGGPVDGGTYPAAMWGDYMGRIKGNFCGDFQPPKTPFQSAPFFGKYAKSGGSLIGAGDPGASPSETPSGTGTDDTTDDGTGGTVAPDEGSDGAETPPDEGDGAFDPDQYESAPQPEPETGPPPAGNDGGATAPPG
jgi:penicillin-binding protein 1A